MRARDFVTESADEEAWELVLQPVPEIQAFVAQMDLGNDKQSVSKIASAIQATPDTSLPATSIPRLKNLANKPGDPDILRAIQKISGQPDAAQQYTTIMARRDAGEGRDRGYDVSNLVPAVKSGNYEPPVLLRLPSGLYVIGGRTRLYAALALDMPIRVKIIGPQTFAKQGVAEGSVTKKPQPYNDPNWAKKLPKEKLNALAGPRYKKDKKEQGVSEVKILSKVKGKGANPDQLPNRGGKISPEKMSLLGRKVMDMDKTHSVYRDQFGGQITYNLFNTETNRSTLTVFGSRYPGNADSFIVSGLYASPDNDVPAAEFYRRLITDLGLTLVSDRKQSPGGQRVWQRLEQMPGIEVHGYDTATGEVINIGAEDEEMYAVPAAAAQGREMARVARDIRLVATAR